MSQCAHKMRLLDTTFFCVERTGHQCAHTYRFLESDVRRFAARAERAEAERDALRKDAERWRALCNLWLMCTILTLTQDEDGRWSIEATEPVDNETFATLTGDDPDSAIDAALAGRE